MESVHFIGLESLLEDMQSMATQSPDELNEDG